jgi:hypothetical protein
MVVLLLLSLPLGRQAYQVIGAGRGGITRNFQIANNNDGLDLDFDLSEGDLDGLDFEEIMSDKNFWKEDGLSFGCTGCGKVSSLSFPVRDLTVSPHSGV